MSQEAANMGTRMRPVHIHSLPKPSDRHERCIVTRKKRQRIFFFLVLWFWFRFFFFPHTSPNVFVSHWRPTNVCVRGFTMSSWKKTHSVLGKESFFCQEHCLFCVCVVISQTVHYSFAFVPFWQQIFLHIKHPTLNSPTDQDVQRLEPSLR